jgi:hypothetical protein
MKEADVMLKLGGRYAQKGTWWSAVDGSVHDMSEGGFLPGDTGVMYIRRPKGGVFVVAPLVALLYAATFPALGPLAVIISWAIAVAGISIVTLYGLFKAMAYTRHLAVLGWRPVTAYFAGLGKRGRKR